MIITFLICLFALSNSNVLAKKEAGPVTCGSVIKLVHKETVSKDVPTQIFPYSISIKGGNLHSHSIAWGSGSGQQSVTANKVKNDKGK